MTIYFLIVFGCYFLFLLMLMVGLKKARHKKSHSPRNNSIISVVVAMRNEKTNIENLLHSLSTQHYPIESFEVIVVNDHSEDGSEQEVRKWQSKIPSLKIISLGESRKGKKAALSLGIETAQGELIATTDADCTVPPEWLASIHESFQEEETKMCLGTVALQDGKSFFSRLQSVEFASVMGTCVSLAALGYPAMCNGANLSFRKKIFNLVGGYAENEHIASGDDEFLMRKINAKFPNSIHPMTDGVVVTKPQPSLFDFIQQRLRWASKWKYNSSVMARLLAIFVFIVQLSWLILAPLVIFFPSLIFLTLVVVKVCLDLALLSYTSRSLRMEFSVLAFAALQLLYPIYVLYIGLFSQVKNHQWKGRLISQSNLDQSTYSARVF